MLPEQHAISGSTSRQHEALLAWDELPESQREKYRALIAGIPAILSRYGYAVIPVAE